MVIFFVPQADKGKGYIVDGYAYIGEINPKNKKKFSQLAPPIGWAKGGDPYTFAHELGHIFGCQHNREQEDHWEGDVNKGKGNPWDMLTNRRAPFCEHYFLFMLRPPSPSQGSKSAL